MLAVDHVVAVHPDPDGAAAALAGALGSTWSSGGLSDDGFRAASVPVGAGAYVDVLWPETAAAGAAGERMRALAPGSLVAWAVEVGDLAALAARLGLTHECGRDPEGAVVYEMVGWPEAVASGGVLPFGVRYRPPLFDRRARADALWSSAPGGGIARLELVGEAQVRAALEATLRAYGGADDGLIGWCAGEAGLRDAVLASGASLAEALGGGV